MRDLLGALQPPTVADEAALLDATGCSVVELLAPAQPPWDVLARLARLMLAEPPQGVPETLAGLAHAMASSGVPAAVWAGQMRAVIAAATVLPAPEGVMTDE